MKKETEETQTPLGVINYYRKLLRDGVIERGGPAYARLRHLLEQYYTNRSY
jgi:hypothetical protein